MRYMCIAVGDGDGGGRGEGRQHSLNHLWHSDFTVLLEGVHHQAVAADVVDALLSRWGNANR